MQLDLSKFASIQEFANNIATKEKKIDFLICNAGVGWKFDSPNITEDGQVSTHIRPVKLILISNIFIICHAVLEYYNQYICYLGADISNKLSRPFYVGQPSMESIKSIGERKV